MNETVLHSFSGGATDGETPSDLIKVGNLLYGTSFSGGRYDKGTVFSISPDGTNFTVLHSFKGKPADGSLPAGLTNVGGMVYGTTEGGGANGKGTVFSIATTGAFATLYSFKGGARDGATPTAPLTNVRGTLYGTTADGGDVGNGACSNCGTVFSISRSGQEKVRYFFGSKKDDGSSPGSKLVNLGGKLYGTTTNGGIGGVTGNGTIFSVTTGGNEAVLYRFKNDSDGSCAFNCFLMNLGGTLYGTAYKGGKNNLGSVFSITSGGNFKTLYSASVKGNAGGDPDAALTNVGGTLYGTMSEGPTGKRGTVFSITTSGALKILYTFTGSDGAKPSSALSLVGKTLFGTTAKGGSSDKGTIYSIAGF
ncbi:MAG TPA: choice-of-anchor tandem repeat GloVer-containing protein [Candidatus Cybelea sp.]|nr:choice-of-anchor tandem repeat GloVer-containing protein [Candidatus Cybelea sp.]